MEKSEVGLIYVGPIAGTPKGKAAIDKQFEEQGDLLAGRTPRLASKGFTVRALCNRFLTAKQVKLEAGELSHELL